MKTCSINIYVHFIANTRNGCIQSKITFFMSVINSHRYILLPHNPPLVIVAAIVIVVEVLLSKFHNSRIFLFESTT